MFATFSSVTDNNPLVYIFSRIYLYVFISLFIYVILSIFIAIILDVYDVIKEYSKDHRPKCRIEDFYSKYRLLPTSALVNNNSGGEESDQQSDAADVEIPWLLRMWAVATSRLRRGNDRDEDGDPLVGTSAAFRT